MALLYDSTVLCMQRDSEQFDISDPLNAWDRSITTLILQRKCYFSDIAKFPAVEFLVAENQEICEAADIHLLQHLQYVFLANNYLETLSQFKRRRALVMLDLSGNRLGLRALLGLRGLEMEFLTIFGNGPAEYEMESLPDHISPRKAHYACRRCERSYPAQGACLCRLLYNNAFSHAENAFCARTHVRLFLVQLFPFAAAINFTHVSEQERELAERYYASHFAELSPLQYQCLLDARGTNRQKYTVSQPSYHYFTFKNFVGHYALCTCSAPCESCASLGIAGFLDEIRFPNKELRCLLLYVMELLYIARYFAFQDYVQQYAANTTGQPKNAYGQMVLPLQVFTPYLFCELLTLNHLLQFGQVRAPRDFLQLAIVLRENDTFSNYFIGIVQRQTAEKIADRRQTLQSLYNIIVQLGEYFLKSVEIDEAYEPFVFDSFEKGGKRGQYTNNVEAEVYRLFCESGGLTMNSIRFFVFQVRVKSNMMLDLINYRYHSIQLSNIDVFSDTEMRFADPIPQAYSYTGRAIEHDQTRLRDTELDVLKRFDSKKK